jgi:hypothetical protein
MAIEERRLIRGAWLRLAGARGLPRSVAVNIAYFIHHFFNDNHKRLTYSLSRRDADKVISMTLASSYATSHIPFIGPVIFLGLEGHFLSTLILPSLPLTLFNRSDIYFF